MVAVTSDCPINLLITDPQGRRLGYDPVTGQVLYEIPGALYTSPDVEPQIILITNPISGTYQITATGYGSGQYGIRVDDASMTGVRRIEHFSGMTSVGQVSSHSMTYTPPPNNPNIFPSTPVLDHFNQPDSPISSTWVGETNNFSIVGQTLKNASGYGRINWDTTFGPDQEIFTILESFDTTNGEVDLVLKDADRGDGWNMLEVVYQPQFNRVQIWTVHNWGTWLQHGMDIPVTFQTGDQFGARARADGTVEVYKNATLIGSVIVSQDWPSRAEGGQIGVWPLNSLNMMLDDLGGGTLP